MALSNARLKAALDAGLSTTTHIGWSENGTTETAKVARTAAICAAVDLVDTPPVARESVGRASYEYADAPTLGGVIRLHLAGTGLLYGGI